MERGKVINSRGTLKRMKKEIEEKMEEEKGRRGGGGRKTLMGFGMDLSYVDSSDEGATSGREEETHQHVH